MNSESEATILLYAQLMADIFERGVRRFPETLVCDQCNSADGQAKRQLKLPANFSFSPSEIRQFVTAAPHEGHRIDIQRAQAIYQTLNLKQTVISPFWTTPPH